MPQSKARAKRLPTAASAVKDRIAVLEEQTQGVLTHADYLNRIRAAAMVDVPRLQAELESYKAQHAKLVKKNDPRDPGKVDASAAIVDEGQAAVDLEQAVIVATSDELGEQLAATPAYGAAGAAHDATVATKEG